MILLLWMGSATCFGQAAELQQLLLDYQKLAQLKNILKDMYKGYEIATKGYNAVKDATKGNFDLHKTFVDGLAAVSPEVRNYTRIADIFNDQAAILREYKKAYDQFRQDPNFNEKELAYLSSVYNNLFSQSVKNLEELSMVITANKLSMSDDERLRSIDRIAADMNDKLSFLRHFNTNARTLAVQKAREQNDAGTLQHIYGIQKQ